MLGPLNGGLPWPSGFVQAEKQKEWITGPQPVSGLPFAALDVSLCDGDYRAPRRRAKSSAYRDKVFFVPENGINPTQIGSTHRAPRGDKLRLIFVGRLVPYRPATSHFALSHRHAAARRSVSSATERNAPRSSNSPHSSGSSQVSFCGWLSHAETLDGSGRRRRPINPRVVNQHLQARCGSSSSPSAAETSSIDIGTAT